MALRRNTGGAGSRGSSRSSQFAVRTSAGTTPAGSVAETFQQQRQSGAPFVSVPPQLLQQVSTSPLPSTFQTAVPGAARLGVGTSLANRVPSTLTKVPWQTVRPWSGQFGGASQIPRGLPGPTSVNPYEAFRQWAARNRSSLPGGAGAGGAGAAGAMAGASLMEAMIASAPIAGAGALMAGGLADQLWGGSRQQYENQAQLPGFSSIPVTPGGTRPTTSTPMSLPGWGNQAVTTPDYWNMDFPVMPEAKPKTPAFAKAQSDDDLTRRGPTADASLYREYAEGMKTVGGGDTGDGIRKNTLDFDFSQYDTLREKSLADALAAINAQYAAQDAGYDAQMGQIGNEYQRLMNENFINRRQGIRDVNASGAQRGLLHSGVYAQGMAELMSAAAAERANVIGTYSTEEGSYGTAARDVESQRKLAEQTKASDVAATRNASAKEKLDLEQLQALLKAGMAG